MYDYLKGTLIETSFSKAVVEVHGIGYSLLIPFNNVSKLPDLGASVLFYISFIVREDAQKFYGFLTQQERDLFESLLEVSGVGPKTALCLIGHMETRDLQAAISHGNTQLICKIPGIGKKTAERLIVDMRDKMKKGLEKSLNTPSQPEEKGSAADALSALIHLGYNSSQAQKAIKTALNQFEGEPELAKLITAALRSV